MNEVNRTEQTFIVTDNKILKNKMLNWASRFSIFAFLDNNGYDAKYHHYECLVGAGVLDSRFFSYSEFPASEQAWLNNSHDWIFGHLNYPGLKPDSMEFPAGFFFIPQIVLELKDNVLKILSATTSPQQVWQEIESQHPYSADTHPQLAEVHSRLDKQTYVSRLQKIREHLQRGDCYELNFCQEFYADNIIIDPVLLYHQLMEISPNPFAVFYRLNDNYCVGGSPERFINRIGTKVISQPIKGTIARNQSNPYDDDQAKSTLQHSEKDKSENVMIVDLVRNDLSKIALKGSVQVEELFGVHPFPQVHHMISTIIAQVDQSVSWTEILDACFPMGSMTGAPKKRVMELTEQYEATPRGLFSGTIGYVKPDGDFDFNVVIRSVFYNAAKQGLNFKAGGGITIKSDPEKEYEESLLKVGALMKILTGKTKED